jgi:hypothetical protein
MNLLENITRYFTKVDEDGKVHDAFNDAELGTPYALCRFDGKPKC